MNAFNKTLILISMSSSILTMTLKADTNRFEVYGGGIISHHFDPNLIKFDDKTDTSFDWGGGFFFGAGYQINFSDKFGLTPKIEINYVDNNAVLHNEWNDFLGNHLDWLASWNLNIPILANYSVSVREINKLRFGIGPYIQWLLKGKQYPQWGTDENKIDVHGSFAKRFNIGAMAEVAFEQGNHLTYFLRANYPFLKEGAMKQTLDLSIGIGYRF